MLILWLTDSERMYILGIQNLINIHLTMISEYIAKQMDIVTNVFVPN